MRKRILSLALALATCLGLMSVPAAALNPGEEWVGDFVVNGDTLMGYYGDGGAITIPDGITIIAFNAFVECTNLTSVTIPESVTLIGSSAFRGCTNLTSVTLPSNGTKIEEDAFNGCTSLKNVTIPDGVASIKDRVFSRCTSLTSVTIPSSVTFLGKDVFRYCTGLKNAVISSSYPYSGSTCLFDGCISLTNVTLSESMVQLQNSMFGGCTSLKNVTIPTSVTSIGAAFKNCTSLTSITIPSGVTGIGHDTFANCTSLTSIVIPSSVQSMSRGIFYGCTGLTDIYYGGSKAQWRECGGEEALTSVGINPTVHFNSTGPSTQPTTPTQPQQPAGNATASPTNDKLEVNGNAADPTVYKIGGSNYFKIRDVAALLDGTEKQFAVGYDGGKQSVTATTGQGYDKQPGDLAGAPAGGAKTAEISNDAIYVNGRKVEAEVYKIDGSNYFKLRDLGRALDFYVGWSADRGMYIETGKPYSE